MSDSNQGKNIALIAHFTWIGLLIAFIMNNDESKKTELASFYIRQMLGLVLTSLATIIISVIPILGWIAAPIVSVILIILWIISIAAAGKGEMKEIPMLGKHFQKWFASIK